jgi:5-methylthioadenosine/S-adenosylhomocysteine deaminase
VIRYHARWVLPISRAPIRDGTVAEANGRITYVGARSDAPHGPGEDRELGDAILLPGLVNAHTHLELTAFRGLIPDLPFREWILTLQRAKTEVMTAERFLDSARHGIGEGLRAGVTTFGDSCDSGVALQAMLELGVRGIMFQEIFGPSPEPADVRAALRGLDDKLVRLMPLETALVRVGVSPHAPFTVSSPLFAELAKSSLPMAIHTAESEAETLLVRDASGPFADGLRARGIEVAVRGRSPVEMLHRLGVLRGQPLLIHCVRVDDEDLDRVAKSGAAIAHCPISNAKLGHGVAPLAAMLDRGIAVGLGSDSMASNDRMHLLEEARASLLMQRASQSRATLLDARRMVELATLGGARALRMDRDVGSLEVGKAADLVAFGLDGAAVTPSYEPEATLVMAMGGKPARLVTVEGRVRVWDQQLLEEDHALSARIRDIESALEQWRASVVAGAGSAAGGAHAPRVNINS